MKKITMAILLILPLLFIAAAWDAAYATPLIAMQAAERCDTCHEEPDRKDPKWIEENYKISERKCRLTCNVCHVNPSGGMLRNGTGYVYGTKSLSLSTDIPDDIARYIEAIRENGFLTIGADFRFMAIRGDSTDVDPLYFPMQADLYLNARVQKHVSLFTQFGLERAGNPSVREAFGLVDNLPYNAYVKFGRFIPPYGLRLDDHTAFIRTKLDLSQAQSDAYFSGVEAGAEPTLFFARAAHFNSDTPPSGSSGLTPTGYSATAGWAGTWLHLSLSYIGINDLDATTLGSTERSAYGAAGALRYKTLTYLFEFDRKNDDVASGGSVSTEDADITFSELDWKAVQGVNLKARYETYSPEASTGEADQKRYVAGVDFYPWPFTEINAQYRVTDSEPGDTSNDFFVIGHIWF